MNKENFVYFFKKLQQGYEKSSRRLGVLIRDFIAVNRKHDHGSCYEGNHVIGGSITVSQV